MLSKPKIVANMENYIVFDKIRAIQGIILKEVYMVIVWGYALGEFEGKIFSRTVLHHWFADNVTWYYFLYNALFPVIDTLIVKFAHFIILNPDKDYQSELFRKVLRELDYLMPIKSILEQSIPPFQNISLEISDVLKSFPNWNSAHLPFEIVFTPNSFITPF